MGKRTNPLQPTPGFGPPALRHLTSQQPKALKEPGPEIQSDLIPQGHKIAPVLLESHKDGVIPRQALKNHRANKVVPARFNFGGLAK